jgi:hypothetical protein
LAHSAITVVPNDHQVCEKSIAEMLSIHSDRYAGRVANIIIESWEDKETGRQKREIQTKRQTDRNRDIQMEKELRDLQIEKEIYG